MSIHNSLVAAVLTFAACVLSGCATTTQGDAEKRAADVTVYKARELANNQYEVVSHTWGELPSHAQTTWAGNRSDSSVCRLALRL